MTETLDAIPPAERQILAQETASAFLGCESRDQRDNNAYFAARKRFGDGVVRDLWSVANGLPMRLAQTLEAADLAGEVLEVAGSQQMSHDEQVWFLGYLRDTLRVSGDIVEARRILGRLFATISAALAGVSLGSLDAETAEAISELQSDLARGGELVADDEPELLSVELAQRSATLFLGYAREGAEALGRAELAGADARAGGLEGLRAAWRMSGGDGERLARLLDAISTIGHQRRDIRLMVGDLRGAERPPAGPLACLLSEPAGVDAFARMAGVGPAPKRGLRSKHDRRRRDDRDVDQLLSELAGALIIEGDLEAAASRLDAWFFEAERAVATNRALSGDAKPRAHALLETLRNPLAATG